MEFFVNVEEVCNFLSVSTEDFNHLTIAEIEEAKVRMEQKRIEERRNDENIMNDYRFFFRAYDLFVKYFGKELVDKYLPIIPLSEIKKEEKVRKGTKIFGKPHRFIGEGTGYFPVLRGPGSRSGRKEYAPADIYEVSSNYQGLLHEKIIRAILAEKYPWLSSFQLEIYEIGEHKGVNEFYLETEMDKALYVPYKSFVKGDIESIKERNREYIHFYYPNPNIAEELLNSKTVQEFFACIEKHIH